MGKKKEQSTPNPGAYQFKLFVAGDEPNSRRAKETLQRFCENHLRGKYVIEVVDVFENYKSALENHILLAPTLIVAVPKPEIKIIGALSDERKILEVLGISEAEKEKE